MIEVTLLIPVASNAGEGFQPAHHTVFEGFMLDRFGGFSRLPGTVAGAWVGEGRRYDDHLIAYVVALASICDGGLLREVVDFAKTHYQQEAIYLRYLGISEIR